MPDLELPSGSVTDGGDICDFELSFPQVMNESLAPPTTAFSCEVDAGSATVTGVTWIDANTLVVHTNQAYPPYISALISYVGGGNPIQTLTGRNYQTWSDLACTF